MTAPIMATKNGTAASGMNYDQVYRLTTHGSNRLGGNGRRADIRSNRSENRSRSPINLSSGQFFCPRGID